MDRTPTPPTPEELYELADLVVVAETRGGDNEETLLDIADTIKGDVGNGPIAITEPYPEGTAAVFFLDNTEPRNVLASFTDRESVRATRRIAAGGPRIEPRPPLADLLAFAELCDAVCWAQLISTDGFNASVTVIEELLGDTSGLTHAIAGPPAGCDEGPWAFPTTMTAVIFMLKREGQWIVVNPTYPANYHSFELCEPLAALADDT